jgi:hypothetical protein
MKGIAYRELQQAQVNSKKPETGSLLPQFQGLTSFSIYYPGDNIPVFQPTTRDSN